MATYNGRRAPNVSQYIANLNTIPSAAEAAAQTDFGGFEADLDLFTNTQFFDFDMNQDVPKLPGDMTFSGEQSRSQQGQDKGLNYVNQPNFQFPDFSFHPPQTQRLSSQSLPPSPPNGLAQYPAPLVPQAQQSYAASPVTGEKRKSVAASITSPVDYEDQSRFAAEEDKRRRNTAASARFRVKKKQREQALEKSAKEMSDKVQFLEARVGQLEMENKWLKGLITEKNLKGVEASSKQSTSDKDTAIEDGDRSTEQRKDGVGTEAKADTEVAA
ncbi:hypothetical protein BDV97DRAFT_400020 [Delphinella strobiligena]|nr:hypothetical protein BDV97DRAFT_400020 [Delphinella strobiligena]